MPRRARVVIEGGVYHVYNRVASGEPVFGDPDEALRFVEVMREVKGRDGRTVFARALMTNHYHLACAGGELAEGSSYGRGASDDGCAWRGEVATVGS